MNQLIYAFATWLDTHSWSTQLHESFYMYNWVESTHVLALMVSLGLLFLIDLRMLGLAFVDIPATAIAHRLFLPMLIGFSVMIVTGLLLFYAIPVRTSQSLWFRIKVVLLIAAAVNAWLFHRRMQDAGSSAAGSWDLAVKAPRRLQIGAALSLIFWGFIVICGRLIAYDWFDCRGEPSPFVSTITGCIADQTQF
ncbi:MAG: hypothetical protein P8J17_07280 [Halioglobus sp.]|nr:hypothetical protein [Halioglobus sp.]